MPPEASTDVRRPMWRTHFAVGGAMAPAGLVALAADNLGKGVDARCAKESPSTASNDITHNLSAARPLVDQQVN